MTERLTIHEAAAPRCINCGRPAQYSRPFRDVCPTDRGDAVRDGLEPICGECLSETADRRTSEPAPSMIVRNPDQVAREIMAALGPVSDEEGMIKFGAACYSVGRHDALNDCLKLEGMERR